MFYLSSEAVKELLTKNGSTKAELVLSLIRPISQLARPPISNFNVGAAGLGKSGAIYGGINLEFPGGPLSHSVHAEQFIITNAMHHGETEIISIAVNAVPCGHCRQFLSELHNANTLEFLMKQEDGIQTYRISDLLPMRFKPQDVLGEDYASALMAPRERRQLQFVKETAVMQFQSDDCRLTAASQIALDAASQSYAPYSGCPSGVALVMKNGGIFGGGCIENCAYNPTLPPLQCAIIHAISKGQLSTYSEIVMAVLVEKEGNQNVSYADVTSALLKVIAPDARCIVLNVVEH